MLQSASSPNLRAFNTAPTLTSQHSSSNLMAGGTSSSVPPKTLEVRERPAKFLRRTTQEQTKLQQERLREANHIPQEIKGDWETSVWTDPQDMENRTIIIEAGTDTEAKLIVSCGTLNALVRHLTSEKTGSLLPPVKPHCRI